MDHWSDVARRLQKLKARFSTLVNRLSALEEMASEIEYELQLLEETVRIQSEAGEPGPEAAVLRRAKALGMQALMEAAKLGVGGLEIDSRFDGKAEVRVD